jgi:hypothetical protein
MSAFYLTLMAVLFSGFGARDQVRIAGMSLRQGPRLVVLLLGLVICVATAIFAAWAATVVAPMLLVPRYKPVDASPSLGMLAFLLLSHQLTDAARFLVFGIAVATNAPLAAGGGGILGGMVLVIASWGFPGLFTHPRTRLIRRFVGLGLLLLTAYVGLQAFGRI